jgi:protein-disulfide isomerase
LVSGGASESLGAAGTLVKDHMGRTASFAVVGALALGLLMWGYPKYWLEASAHAAAPELPKVELPPAPNGSAQGKDVAFTSGVTKDGNHWIGASKPKVVVEEYSDYECPFCRIAHVRLRALLQKHPGKIRLVHRHFPLDQLCNPIITQPFHANACYYSALVTCAGEQKQFWKANDYVFEHSHDPEPIDKDKLAKDLGIDGKQLHECLEKRAWNKMRGDLQAGIKLGIRGTPTFVVDGEQLTGGDPEQMVERYLK